MTITNRHYCRVCGFFNIEPPWGEDGISPNYDYCPCCGVEFGNQDYTITTVRKYRSAWIAKGANWMEINKKPKEWNMEEQLNQVPDEFR